MKLNGPERSAISNVARRLRWAAALAITLAAAPPGAVAQQHPHGWLARWHAEATAEISYGIPLGFNDLPGEEITVDASCVRLSPRAFRCDVVDHDEDGNQATVSCEVRKRRLRSAPGWIIVSHQLPPAMES